MNDWISHTHYPLLKVTRNYSARTVTVSQKSFDNHMYNQDRWWIPITYTWQSGSNFGLTFPKVWLDPNVQNLTLEEIYDNDDWFIANIRQIGKYSSIDLHYFPQMRIDFGRTYLFRNGCFYKIMKIHISLQDTIASITTPRIGD